MTSIFDGLEGLKRRVGQANEELNKVEGAISQIKKDRKKRFGVSEIKQSKKLLKKLERIERKRVQEYTDGYRTWEDTNGKRLDELLGKKKSSG